MLRRILAAVGRALARLSKTGWAALEDAITEPGAAVARTWSTIQDLAAFGQKGLGAAARTAEWTTSTIGSAMPSITLGGGQALPPEPPSERLQRPYPADILTRKVPDFEPDMSPSWYAAAAYIMGGKAFGYPGVKEDFDKLAKSDPKVHAWALALSPAERKMVVHAGFDAMVSHLKGVKSIDGVRLAGRHRVPDGILDTSEPRRQTAFELDDGYDLSPAMART